MSQGLHQKKRWGKGVDGTLRAIERLGYIQIDTISVVERAHHHALWSRVQNYQTQHLTRLLENRDIFEYWSHAAAYLPIRDFRFSLPRKHAIKTGMERHWHERNPKKMSHVLKRFEAEGPLSSRDFADSKHSGQSGGWDWKPAKVALEQLFMEGDLMVSKRQGFQKIYDLTERVLPSNVDTRMPSESEFLRHLITRYLCANGIGTATHISYLRKGLKSKIETRCAQMLEDGELIEVALTNRRIKNQRYYALSSISDLLSKPLSQKKVKVLSPFDNVLIQRKRTLELFDFDYQIECYVPAAKRQYGYFCLPLLWGQDFAGRMDAKMDRKSGVLNIINLHLETEKTDEFMQALEAPLNQFLAFNQGSEIVYTQQA